MERFSIEAAQEASIIAISTRK